MNLNDDFMRQLMDAFAIEAKEHIQAINQRLLALEQSPETNNPEILTEIFRVAHTLKGASRAVGLAEVNGLSHHLETLFGKIQSQQLAPTPEIFDLVYQVVDAIDALVQDAVLGRESTVDAESLLAALQRAVAGEPISAPAPQDSQAPSSSNGGRDSSAPEPVTPDLTAQNSSTLESASEEPGRSADLVSAEVADGKQRRSAPQETHVDEVMPDAPPATQIASDAPQTRSGKQLLENVDAMDSTVRIATSKLDTLMAQMGELQVARIGMEQILEDVYSLIEEVDSWYSMWRQVRHLYTRINSEMVESDTTFAMHRSASPGSIGQQARLKRMIGFLHSNEKKLLSSRGNLQRVYKRVKTDIYRMEQVVSDIQDTVRQIRMLPIGTAFDSFPRLVRDLARSLGKEIDFSIEGGATEVDRSIIEKIKAPLIHLLRNAVDHGIEMPEERVAAGKPRRGSVRISVWQYGSNVKIEIRDDGRGIDVSAVRANAVKSGVLTKEAADSMEDREILWMIFRTGLSTRDEASDISGRGIGLDVVREHIDQMHGVIEVSSHPGKGTSFLLTLPLTVATTLAVVVAVGRHLFALPASNVIRIVRLTDKDWGYAEGRRVFRLEGRSIMLTGLADVLGLGTSMSETRPDTLHTALVLGVADQRIVFAVDEVMAIHEVVVKQLPKPFVRVKGLVGATILGNGEIVPILHVGDLIRHSFGVSSLPSGQIVSREHTEPEQPTIMVVDDSITTRTLEKSILETAGFQVQTAVDGEDAWEKLQTNKVDLVVTDVNMPRLDGFGLTARIRSHIRFEDLPVVLVTSLDSREDQEKGVEAGANAYITKGAFDQEHLLETIQKLI